MQFTRSWTHLLGEVVSATESLALSNGSRLLMVDGVLSTPAEPRCSGPSVPGARISKWDPPATDVWDAPRTRCPATAVCQYQTTNHWISPSDALAGLEQKTWGTKRMPQPKSQEQEMPTQLPSLKSTVGLAMLVISLNANGSSGRSGSLDAGCQATR